MSKGFREPEQTFKDVIWAEIKIAQQEQTLEAVSESATAIIEAFKALPSMQKSSEKQGDYNDYYRDYVPAMAANAKIEEIIKDMEH